MTATGWAKEFWSGDCTVSVLDRYKAFARKGNLKTLRPKNQLFSVQSGQDFVESLYGSATPRIEQGGSMATKKASKKAAAKKSATKGTRGNTYQSTADGRKKFEAMTGQGKIVADGLIKNEPITSSDLADKVGKSFETKQDPKRVVGFYLSQWKADGLVKNGPKPAAAE
jgi:hypothetical protein